MPAPTALDKPKLRNLFTVKGDSSGIKTELSKAAIDKIYAASAVLYALSKAGETFPLALALSARLGAFLDKPTAKDETPKQ